MEVPGIIALTTPVVGLIVAMLVVPPLHVPPEGKAVNVVVVPGQRLVMPENVGNGFMVTVLVAKTVPQARATV